MSDATQMSQRNQKNIQIQQLKEQEICPMSIQFLVLRLIIKSLRLSFWRDAKDARFSVALTNIMASLNLDIELGKMFRVFAFFIALLCPYAVSADADNPLGISIYGSFLHTEQVPNTLFFFSDIEENDSFELRKAIRIHDIDTVVLSSRGGSVWEGLNMAGIIFDKGLKTYVPKKGLGKEGNCASACSFMFFGGSTRVADGKLGVHQFYSGTAKESAQIGKTQSNAQFTVSEIIGFLNEFETPPFVFERMFQQKEMYYFNKKELDEIARNNEPITDDNLNAIDRFIGDFTVVLSNLKASDEPEVLAPSAPVDVTPKTTEVVVEIVEPVEETTKEIETPEVTEISEVEEKQLIKDIQTELNRLNCNAGKADGVIGKLTKAALKRYANAGGISLEEAAVRDQRFLDELQSSKVKCKIPPKLQSGATTQKLSLYYSCRENSVFSHERSKVELKIWGVRNGTKFCRENEYRDDAICYRGNFVTENEEYTLFTHPYYPKKTSAGTYDFSFFINAKGLSKRAPSQLWYNGKYTTDSNGAILKIESFDEYDDCYFSAER